jgi:hypothetical protein
LAASSFFRKCAGKTGFHNWVRATRTPERTRVLAQDVGTRMMRLQWLTFKHDNRVVVMIVPAESELAARLKATYAGQQGEFIKSYELSEAMTKKVSMNMIGRTLTAVEAEKLLEKLG